MLEDNLEDFLNQLILERISFFVSLDVMNDETSKIDEASTKRAVDQEEGIAIPTPSHSQSGESDSFGTPRSLSLIHI